MISTVSHTTPIVTVSVGQEVRVRETHKTRNNEVHQNISEPIVVRGQLDEKESHDSKIVDEPVDKIISRLQDTLRRVEPRIELSIDKELNQVIFRIFDKDSGELIKQIPSEEVLELDRFFADQSGLFVEEEI